MGRVGHGLPIELLGGDGGNEYPRKQQDGAHEEQQNQTRRLVVICLTDKKMERMRM